jgi:hypothetical protein
MLSAKVGIAAPSMRGVKIGRRYSPEPTVVFFALGEWTVAGKHGATL